jgi:hypothetical protein
VAGLGYLASLGGLRELAGLAEPAGSLAAEVPMRTRKQHRRALRRAESKLFEAVAAADDGDVVLARELLAGAVTPRRARPAVVAAERAWVAGQRARVSWRARVDAGAAAHASERVVVDDSTLK